MKSQFIDVSVAVLVITSFITEGRSRKGKILPTLFNLTLLFRNATLGVCLPFKTIHTAISRKVVGKNMHATIPGR